MGIDGCCLSTGVGRHLAFGPEIGHWTARRVDGKYFEEGSSAIGLKKDDKIVAGVIYEHWNGKSIVCHMAVEGRLTRDFIWTIFDYPFNQCDVEKIISPVASSNLNSVKLVLNMGFEEEARISNAHPTGDLVFYTLNRVNCRFIGDTKWVKAVRAPRQHQTTLALP